MFKETDSSSIRIELELWEYVGLNLRGTKDTTKELIDFDGHHNNNHNFIM